eukprot:CAMPEP_0197829414 /NCGR_PEP_ID=MMETSP1437-20131217/5870_1 /TAXON_ID=49252 ORGANISM="Eucampia antarctica, Strain CCMP1452" /NCGR_SAMPLE_ID=MMETSP1437 /ASSEMBLY_ACC=CAM_ASM_001096 /LENGTH=46 /DNA_ID= /DNA_START= /DNA_END= /DNA_ORIENTATION=
MTSQCSLPDIDLSSINNIVIMAQQKCIGEGVFIDTEEVKELSMAVA